MWLITAGPTREHLDDVRFLSNASSGRMGYALAAAARAAGREVVLVSGPVEIAPPPGVERIQVVSALEMLAAAESVLQARRCPVLAGVAAVCDYRPRLRQPGKPPKSAAPVVELVENPDVVATLAGLGIARFAFGFALEAIGGRDAELAAAEARARAKMARKHLDAIVLNGIETLGSPAARALWLPRAGPRHELAMAKDDLARWLVATVEASVT